MPSSSAASGATATPTAAAPCFASTTHGLRVQAPSMAASTPEPSTASTSSPSTSSNPEDQRKPAHHPCLMDSFTTSRSTVSSSILNLFTCPLPRAIRPIATAPIAKAPTAIEPRAIAPTAALPTATASFLIFLCRSSDRVSSYSRFSISTSC